MTDLNVHDEPLDDIARIVESHLVDADLPCGIITGKGLRKGIVMTAAEDMGLQADSDEFNPGRVLVSEQAP